MHLDLLWGVVEPILNFYLVLRQVTTNFSMHSCSTQTIFAAIPIYWKLSLQLHEYDHVNKVFVTHRDGSVVFAAGTEFLFTVSTNSFLLPASKVIP